MLFNDFFLLTRVKRPLVTKIFQIIHRHSKFALTQSNFDWFDAPESNHLYLIIHKKVDFLENLN